LSKCVRWQKVSRVSTTVGLHSTFGSQSFGFIVGVYGIFRSESAIPIVDLHGTFRSPFTNTIVGVYGIFRSESAIPTVGLHGTFRSPLGTL